MDGDGGKTWRAMAPISCQATSGAVAARIKQSLAQHGIAFLADLHSTERMLAITNELGVIEKSRTGDAVSRLRAIDMGSDRPGASKEGYKPAALPLHTDRSCSDSPPDIVFTVLATNGSCGGEAWLVNMSDVIDWLKAHGPHVLVTLKESSFSFELDGVIVKRPLLEEHVDGRLSVRLRLDDQLLVGCKQFLVLQQFLGVIENFKYEKKFNEGEGYVINNGWFLHGQAAYQGRRELWRTLIHSELPKLGIPPRVDHGTFFDLDDCLFPFHASGVAKFESSACGRFLLRRFGLRPDQVDAVRQCVQANGTTVWETLLRLNHTHLTPELLTEFKAALLDEIPYNDLVKRDAALRSALLAIPGPRFVLTNNFRGHAERVLDLMGVRDLFARIIAIDDLNIESATAFLAKPSAHAYKLALNATGVRCGLMVDDSHRNCAGAVEAGMLAVQMIGHLKFHSGTFSPMHSVERDTMIPVIDNMSELVHLINHFLPEKPAQSIDHGAPPF